MKESEITPGQIYDSNFSARTSNVRKNHPDLTEEEVINDSIQAFGAREEFIREWLGG